MSESDDLVSYKSSPIETSISFHYARQISYAYIYVTFELQSKRQILRNDIYQMCSGTTRGRVLDGELYYYHFYAQRFQKLIYLHLLKDCFMKISPQSPEQIHCKFKELIISRYSCKKTKGGYYVISNQFMIITGILIISNFIVKHILTLKKDKKLLMESVEFNKSLPRSNVLRMMPVEGSDT